MGFSVSAASAIILAGLAYGGSLVSASYFSAQGEVQQAMADAERRAAMARQGDLAITQTAWNNGQKLFSITLSNTGSVTFNIASLDVVIDGTYHTANITSKQVGGTTTDVWPPATTLVVTVLLQNQPTDAVVIVNTGAKAYWRA